MLQVRTGVVPSANLSRETYMKAIVPIGALFAVTLWLSNAAYLYLSVSFIQVGTSLALISVKYVALARNTNACVTVFQPEGGRTLLFCRYHNVVLVIPRKGTANRNTVLTTRACD